MSLSEAEAARRDAEAELRQKEAAARPEIIPKETPEERAQRERREQIRREELRENDHP